MTQVTKKFTISDREDYLWIRLQEGEKKGLDFAIPMSHPKYGPKLESTIEELEEGDGITATLQSENERNTKWRFVSIEVDWKHA